MLNDKNNPVIDAFGNAVTGNDGDRYNRGWGKDAPLNGYKRDSLPYQYHYRDMDSDGNTANEEFADIFMNFTFDNFANNPAGTALYSWASTNMSEWVTYASTY